VSQYDIAIVGADLGGLISGALLGARGKKSFLCTPRSSLADALGTAEHGDFSFLRGPALCYGFEPGGAFDQLFADLNITDITPTIADVYQVALPDRRIKVSAHLGATLDELRREFPREITSIENFYQEIKKVSLGVAKNRFNSFVLRFRSARSLIAKYHFSREFLSFLDIQAFYFFQRPILELSLKDLLLLCTHKPFRNDDGCRKIAERLAAAILRQGGAIQYNDPSAEILFRNNRVVGLQTAQGAIEASSVLVDNPEKIMPVLFLGIRDQVVPMSMERDVLYLPDYLQPRSFLFLSLNGREDRTIAPDGMRALTAAFHVPKEGAIANRDFLVSQIAGLVPFLSDFLVFSREPDPLLKPAVFTDISFKPFEAGKSNSLLFRGSKKNVYRLHDLQDAPLLVIPAVRTLISILA
jgi:phytoene dehydrogenase-like protein